MGFNPDSRDRDLPFSAKDEAATLPRVSELVVITRHSPWCTIVKNKHGVTLADVCGALFKECVLPFVPRQMSSLTAFSSLSAIRRSR